MNKQVDEVSRYQKKICSWTMSSALIVAIVFLILQEKAIAKGLTLGACFSVVNFFLMGRFIPMTLGKSRAQTRVVGLVSILSRYVLLAIPLILAVKYESLDLLATVIGIFAVQIVLILVHVVIGPLLNGRQG